MSFVISKMLFCDFSGWLAAVASLFIFWLSIFPVYMYVLIKLGHANLFYFILLTRNMLSLP